MPKIEIEVCAFCAKQHIKGDKQHWTETFGSVVLDFSRVPSVQWKGEFDLVCRGCSDTIKAAINAAVSSLRPPPPTPPHEDGR